MEENISLKQKGLEQQSSNTTSNNNTPSLSLSTNPITNYSNPFTENDQIIISDNEDISTSTGGEINIPPFSSTPSMEQVPNPTFITKIKKIFSSFFSCIQSYLSVLGNKIKINSSYKYFTIFLILGLLFMFFSIFNLPFILFNPNRLLCNLSIGNILIITSFLFYYGSTDFFGFLTDQNRGGIMVTHLFGVFGGFILSFMKFYFIAVVVDVGLIITTVMFILTLLPGGQSGIALIKTLLMSPIVNLFNKLKGNKGLPQ